MSELQWKASNPDYSIWVSASAGTGKTKILTDRVLRLLLKGADPQKILCLTFTNAAASEMRHRIDTRLSKWVIIDNKDLKIDLQNMFACEPNKDDLQNAKELFNKSLKPYGKIEIHTIHSYCQKILKRFPLEANISPGFQIIDEIKAKEILNKIKNQMYLDDSHDDILNFFTANFHEITINDILDQVINQKLKFKNYYLEHNYEASSVRKIAGAFNHSNDFEEIRKLCLKIKKLVNLSNDRVDENDILRKIIDLDINNKTEIFSLFLTKDREKKQRLISKKLATENPLLLEECLGCQDKIYQYDQNTKTDLMIQYSKLLKGLAEIFINKYEKYKIVHGFLDYDDLIYHTKNLFNLSHVRDWILYKLDGGIDHLLVDEAQDTSPYQWEIIEAMIAEFYAGHSARNNARTIFVVGDEKQSIFSFQGADLDSLNLTSSKLKHNLLAAEKKYENISLQYSYRSVPSIIGIVYHVFDHIKKSLPEFFPAENPKILPFRDNHAGKVKLWPLIEDKKTQAIFWPKPSDYDSSSPAQNQLAVMIAQYIKCEIDKGEILSSTGLAVRAQDFMILLRKRDSLATEIINELKNQSLPIAGIDRMLLSENLSVIDLISVAKFVVSPQDDLNFAILLKSPLIGLDEVTLNEIIKVKNFKTIWNTIKDLDDIFLSVDLLTVKEKLFQFLELYNISDCSNFFHIVADTFGYRSVVVQNNGADSNDAINELLYLSHNYACNINNSLQSFIYWFETNEIEIKRNVQTTDKIRIMTVHGSKGLQAPIVILCDTTSLPKSKNKFYHDENNQLMAVQQSAQAPKIFNDYKDSRYQKDLQEYIRLLYVGMTRPQDHLIICGYKPKEKLSPYCWYNLVADSMKEIGQMSADNVIIFESSIDKNSLKKSPESTRQLNFNFGEFPDNKIEDKAKTLALKTIDHVSSPILSIKDILLAQLPSQPNSIVLSPLIKRNFLEYGKIFHKILEDSIKAKDLTKLLFHPLIGSLNAVEQNKIHKSMKVLLEKGELTKLIKYEVMTEVNMGILDREEMKLGRIDLLCIGDRDVTIIDYKSDANPAKSIQDIPKAYIDQLSFYSEAVQKIYPSHIVVSMILWLETGELMKVL